MLSSFLVSINVEHKTGGADAAEELNDMRRISVP